jgi:hypothetical protein
MELEKSAEQVLPGKEGEGEGVGVGAGWRNDPNKYAYVNK